MCSLWERLEGEKMGTPVSVSEGDTIILMKFFETQHFIIF